MNRIQIPYPPLEPLLENLFIILSTVFIASLSTKNPGKTNDESGLIFRKVWDNRIFSFALMASLYKMDDYVSIGKVYDKNYHTTIYRLI